MSEIATPGIRRLWVALDAVGCEAVDWNAALDLAALIGAELQGLFVEDEDLLELAALPIAHELGSISGQPRPLQRESVESALRRRVQHAATELERAGKQRRVAVSHKTARGKLVRQALAQGEQGDVVLLRAALAQRTSGRTQRRTTGPITLWCDAAAMRVQVMDLALYLARQTNAGLVVSFPAAVFTDHNRLRSELHALFEQAPGAVVLSAVREVRPESIAEAARAARSATIVLAADGPLTTAAALEYLAKSFHGGVFLVR